MNYGYYNGQIAPLDELKAPVLDRAFYFGDGVYDVTTYVNGRYFAMDSHYERFTNSCRMINIEPIWTKEELTGIFDKLVELTKPEGDALIYFQASRGTALRDHKYNDGIKPNLFAYAKPIARVDTSGHVKIITEPDIRFEICNIKTLDLLPNVMAAQKASKAGCYEAALYRGETVTEGSHSSIMIISGGKVIIPPLTRYILPSITRKYVLMICEELGLPHEVRTFTLDEMKNADEVIVGSASAMFRRVSEIDGIPVGGKAEALFTKLAKAYEYKYDNE
ncbi:MAG: aminotransferase class IV [Clostridia bacterium]|nr:aminotransferase class IV [Clostridia bacterium]